MLGIHEMPEDLRADKHAVIRQKGATLLCPMDGKPGASYVHALDRLSRGQHTGPSTIMLSYCWAYPIGDIVDTLQEYC